MPGIFQIKLLLLFGDYLLVAFFLRACWRSKSDRSVEGVGVGLEHSNATCRIRPCFGCSGDAETSGCLSGQAREQVLAFSLKDRRKCGVPVFHIVSVITSTKTTPPAGTVKRQGIVQIARVPRLFRVLKKRTDPVATNSNIASWR